MSSLEHDPTDCPRDCDVAVIGAGAIGVSIAYELAKSGRSVTVLDRSDVCSGASHGNAGWVFPNHGAPLAKPGAMRQALRWLFDSSGPLYIKPRMSWALVHWLFEFWRACNEGSSRRTFGLNRELALRSLELTELWVAQENLDCHFGRQGVVLVCESEAGLSESLRDLAVLRSFGGDAQVLGREALLEKVPCLKLAPAGGIFFAGDGHLRPDEYVKGLAEAARSKGAVFQQNTEVLGFQKDGNRVQRILTTRGEFEAAEVVLAAGAWSKELGRSLACQLSLEPAKGYSVTVGQPPGGPEVPLLLRESKVAVTPMGEQLRFAGTLELAGLDLGVDLARVRTVWAAACRHIEGVQSQPHFETWRGLRPCSPDDLPYIGRLGSVPNVLVATGHGMSGISQSAITGRLVAQLIAGQAPEIDISPLRPERFSSRP